MSVSALKLDKKKIFVICSFVFALLALFLVYRLFCVGNHKYTIYTNTDLTFYSQDGNYMVASSEFAGIYERTEKANALVLKVPIYGKPLLSIEFDNENQTIAGKKYHSFKSFDFDLTVSSFLKLDLFSSNTNSISEAIKDIKEYNNVSWFAETIMGKQRKCARIVDGKENVLFKVYFSDTGNVESIEVETNGDMESIKSVFNLNRLKELPYIETFLGNKVFFAPDGTISAIKNKATGEIAKYEIRLYGSSGLLFIENFVTDAEFSSK